MNHFSYDVIGKEKVKDLQGEGLRSQAFHRSGASTRFLFRLPKFVLMILAILGSLAWIIR